MVTLHAGDDDGPKEAAVALRLARLVGSWWRRKGSDRSPGAWAEWSSWPQWCW
jgi:hypothetical protein